MTRMHADAFGLCQTPDGRTIPCNPPSGNGLAQLALMLRGSGWLDRNYAESEDAMTNPDQSQSANPSRPAYENNWAAMPGNVGPFDAGSHLPITKAQEIFITPADPYIETLPWRPYGPEYIPIPPQVRPFPTMPDETGPVPFIGPNRLDGDDKGYNRPAPSRKDCDEEWANAARTCNDKQAQLRARGIRRKFDLARCMRGYVSEDCGGNPVQWGKGRRITA